MNQKVKWGLLGALLVAIIASFFLFDFQELLLGLLAWIESLGIWGPVVFVVLYIIATVLFIPATFLTLGGGLVFGVVYGSVWVSIGSTLGAAAAFLVGRYLARDWIAHKIEKHPKFNAIDHAVGKEGWKIVGLTRLAPIFPYNLLNYAYGLTKVSFKEYFFASWVCMLPATIVYVYVGSLAGGLATLGTSGSRTTGEWVLLGVGLLAIVVVTVYITRIAKRALDKKIQS